MPQRRSTGRRRFLSEAAYCFGPRIPYTNKLPASRLYSPTKIRYAFRVSRQSTIVAQSGDRRTVTGIVTLARRHEKKPGLTFVRPGERVLPQPESRR